jgi:hypothetical protein
MHCDCRSPTPGVPRRSIKDRWGLPPLLGSSGDQELLAAGKQAYPLALLLLNKADEGVFDDWDYSSIS